MPGEMHWGPFTLQWSMLSWIAAILAGYGLMYGRLKRSKDEHLNSELLTIISNAIFTFIIVWKFGAVISDISLIWTRPLGLLLFTGGLQETYYGILAAVVIVLYSLRKRRLSIRPFAEILSWGILGCVIVYELFSLRSDPLNLYVCILAACVLLSLLQIKRSVLDAGLAVKRFCIGFGLGMLLITLIAQQQAMSLLTMEQIRFSSMVLIGLFANPLLNFIDYSFIVHPNEGKERDDMNNPTEQNNGA
jgi:hypothetical protein